MLPGHAIYRRTLRGQQELLLMYDGGQADMRLLARVNGFTPLQALLDLSSEEASMLTQSIEALLRGGLVERCPESA